MHKRIVYVFIIIFIAQGLSANKGDFGGSLDFLLPVQKISAGDIEQLFPTALFEPFCRLNEDGTPYSNIFKSVEFNSEDLTLLLELNDDLKWHDGSPITADEIYGAIKSFAEKMRSSGFIASDGEAVLFQTSVIKIRLQVNPDPVFYYLMSKAFFTDNLGKNRWAGPFVPQAVPDGMLILHANQYSLSGRPYLDEVRFRPGNYDRFAASLLSLGCGGADFDMFLPDYCIADEESFSIKKESTLFFLAIGDGVPLYYRKKIAALMKSSDFIKGIARGNAVKTEVFPLPVNAVENAVQPEITPAGTDSPAAESETIKPTRCPEMEIRYMPYSVFPLLAERIKAILQSAGYKVTKSPLGVTDNFKGSGPGGSRILITAIGLNENLNLPWHINMLELLDIFALSSGGIDGFIKDGSPDIDAFREIEKRLIEAGRLFYIFTADRNRVFTCGVGGDGGFEDYYITKSGNIEK